MAAISTIASTRRANASSAGAYRRSFSLRGILIAAVALAVWAPGALANTDVDLLLSCMNPSLRVVATVLFNTGRRVSEMLSAKRSDLFLRPGREHLYLGHTKEGRPRVVWLNDAAAGTLDDRDQWHDVV